MVAMAAAWLASTSPASAEPAGVFGGCPAPRFPGFAGAPAPSTELTARLALDPDSKKWKVLDLRLGHRSVVRWSSHAGIDCVSGILVSSDRRTVLVEIVRSRMTLMVGDDPRQLLLFHLRQPLPRRPHPRASRRSPSSPD